MLRLAELSGQSLQCFGISPSDDFHGQADAPTVRGK